MSVGFATYPGLRRARVVLVEGFDDLRDVFTMTFAHAGFDVRAFAAAHEAFASVANDAPHVVIVGASPPELSDEFGRRLRGDERTRRAARIAVTEQPDRAGELAALFHSVLVKPVDTEHLLDEVVRLVASWGVAFEAERPALAPSKPAASDAERPPLPASRRQGRSALRASPNGPCGRRRLPTSAGHA